MIADKTINKDQEKVYFPKIDNSRLHSTIFVIIAIIAIYVSIMSDKIWVSFIVIIPILYLSRAEEQKQGKINILRQIRDFLSQIGTLILICAIFGIIVFLMFEIGVFYVAIIAFIVFKLYGSITSAITRKNFEKNQKWKSEVL